MSSASNFRFLALEWPALHESAGRAEAYVNGDPRSACFYARRTLELVVEWLYAHDASLKRPYQDTLAALLHEPTFKNGIGPARFAKARLIKDIGNQAVHSGKPIKEYDALNAVRELFHLAFWLARTYSRGPRPADGLTFDQSLIPPAGGVAPQSLAQLQALEARLHEQDAQLAGLVAEKLARDEELQRLQAEIAAAKQKNAAIPDTHDYSEANTRKYLIDLLLREAGWTLDQPRDTEYEVTGMPNEKGIGKADYVLWGDDGRPLAVVEAKRTTKDPAAGKQQAKLYADCLEKQFGQPSRDLLHKRIRALALGRRQLPSTPRAGLLQEGRIGAAASIGATTRKPLGDADVNQQIVERYYQTRAIRRIGGGVRARQQRKALVVMATGAGKTRTVIALC